MPVKLENISSIAPNSSGQIEVTSDLNLIGTTPVPVYRVNGTSIVSSQWVNGAGGAIYYNAGNVGIGRTPAFGLDVLCAPTPYNAGFKSTTTNCYVGIDTTGGGGHSAIDFLNNGTRVAEIDYGPTGMTFWTQNASVLPMTISPDGSVAIGGAAPFQNPLSVMADPNKNITLMLHAYNDQQLRGATIYGLRGRGTPTAMTPVQVGDTVGVYMWGAMVSSTTSVDAAGIEAFITGVGANSVSSNLNFLVNDGSSIQTTLQMYIHGATGNVAIATTANSVSPPTPQGKLEVRGYIRSSDFRGWPTSGSGMDMWFNNGRGSIGAFDALTGSYLETHVDGTPLVLNGWGGQRCGIGANNPTHALELSVDDAAKPGTNTWTITSDIRTKKNVQPLDGGLAVINRLEPIVSEYNGKANTPDGTRVVSLDPAKLRDILPHAVSSVKTKLNPEDEQDTDVLSVNTHEILYHLVLAVQQLARKN